MIKLTIEQNTNYLYDEMRSVSRRPGGKLFQENIYENMTNVPEVIVKARIMTLLNIGYSVYTAYTKQSRDSKKEYWIFYRDKKNVKRGNTNGAKA